MPQLTMKRFVELFKTAMKELELRPADVRQRTGAGYSSIKRYRGEAKDYALQDPPSAKNRRKMEMGMGLPPGYLDGVITVDWEQLRRDVYSGGASVKDVTRRVQQTRALIDEELVRWSDRAGGIPADLVGVWVGWLVNAATGAGPTSGGPSSGKKAG